MQFYRSRRDYVLPGWVASKPSPADLGDLFAAAGGASRMDWTFVITGVPSQVSPDTNFAGYDENGLEVWRWAPGEIATRSYYKDGSAFEYDMVEMANEYGYDEVETLDDVIAMLRGQLAIPQGAVPPWEFESDDIVSYITQAENVQWEGVTEVVVIDKDYA